MVCKDDNQISSQLKEFWKLEEISSREARSEDSPCERHFVENTSRNRDGRFVVALPRRSDKSYLGDSLRGAIRRFQSLEFKFKQNPTLYKDYSEFMSCLLYTSL